jgi:hypothetical protein
MTAAAISSSGFEASPVVAAIRAIYRTAVGLSEFIDEHIEALMRSADAVAQATGRVLSAAKKGLAYGYAAPIIAIAIGQMLLGNPLSAITGAVSMAISPVALTCAAIGAIWLGWRALTDAERTTVLERAAAGLDLTLYVVRSVVDFVEEKARRIFQSGETEGVTALVREQAKVFGRTLHSITKSVGDRIKDVVPRKPPTPEGGHEALVEVLGLMTTEELRAFARGPLRCSEDVEALSDADLRGKVEALVGDAAAHSLPWSERPDYPDIVAMVAKQLDLPTPSGVHVRELERLVLFKVLEVSLEKLDDGQREALLGTVHRELKERGVEGRVAFDELVRFVKFGGMDVGGSLGGLVMAGPGLYGVVGLNFLQFVILKGIILTSGYMAGGAALLGIGTGGALLSIAGAAGPIGAGLAVLYTAYSLSGPAFRKLVPAVCVIAAKRLELTQATTGG